MTFGMELPGFLRKVSCERRVSHSLDDELSISVISVASEGAHIWLRISGMSRVSRRSFPWPELVPFGRKLVAE